MKGVSISDRLFSALAYGTCGVFSLVLIIAANIMKKRMTPFLIFNLYQAIFLSVVLYIFSIVYSIAVNILSVIPFIGSLAKGFDLFFNQTPLYFGCTLSGFVVALIIIYLIVFSLFGRRPHIPMVSDLINGNFGG